MTVYTADEMEAAKTEAVTAATTAKEDELKKVNEELAKVRQVNVDKTENFKKFRDLTEDEKKAYDENTLLLMKRADKLEEDLAKETTTRTERETRDRELNKTNALLAFHAGKDDIKKTLEEKYALLAAMPETTPQEINARAREAAKLAGISVESVNPLYQHVNGDAPVYREKKEYTESPEGKEAADLVRSALNLPKK